MPKGGGQTAHKKERIEMDIYIVRVIESDGYISTYEYGCIKHAGEHYNDEERQFVKNNLKSLELIHEVRNTETLMAMKIN